MSFHVGQRVVCVDASVLKGYRWRGDSPEVGRVYTVRRIFVDPSGCLAFWLDEILRSESARALYGDDIGYAARRFRPVRETSIECLRAHLAPIKQRERA